MLIVLESAITRPSNEVCDLLVELANPGTIRSQCRRLVLVGANAGIDYKKEREQGMSIARIIHCEHIRSVWVPIPLRRIFK